MIKQQVLITTSTIFILATLLLGFTFKLQAAPGILTMRVAEGSGPWDSSITIVDENGKIEKIELAKIKTGNMSENLVTINQQLNKIISNGYKLVSTTGGIEGVVVLITTYTFIKE